jgi:putative two-component system response regulator
VLLVDDDRTILRLTEELLKQDVDCDIVTAESGEEALDLIEASPPDLVLLDYQMPRMDGFEVCRAIKAEPRTRLVPVVMVTAVTDTVYRVKALQAGADDFLTKPVEVTELTARVQSLIKLKRLYDRLDDSERVIFALAKAVEAKDASLEAHTERVARNSRALGVLMGLDEDALDDLYRGGVIHDIGKIGIPDAILLKHGPLDPDEWTLMKQHPVIGEEIVRPLRSAQNLLAIVRHHHENVDGSGYPDGLAGDGIPLLARIVTVCDGFDALTTSRPYRPGMPRDAAIALLREGAGKQWDAEIVPLFVDRIAMEQQLPDAPEYSSARWADSAVELD